MSENEIRLIKLYEGISFDKYAETEDIRLADLNELEYKLYCDVHGQIFENPMYSDELKGIPEELLNHPIVLKAQIDAKANLKGIEKLLSVIN